MTMDNAMDPEAPIAKPIPPKKIPTMKNKKQEFTNADWKLLTLFILLAILSASLSQIFLYNG